MSDAVNYYERQYSMWFDRWQEVPRWRLLLRWRFRREWKRYLVLLADQIGVEGEWLKERERSV